MNVEDLTVTIPRKEGVAAEEAAVAVWPLIEAALDKIGADAVTRDAARAALQYSDGCVVLANYLNSEAKRCHTMDYRFKGPLIVLAAQMARDDGYADSVYDAEEGALYFETDDGQYSFHVFKDWTIDWPAVADTCVDDYEWSGIENQTWALDRLIAFLEYDEEAADEAESEEA